MLLLLSLGMAVPAQAGQPAPVVAVFLIENRGTSLSPDELASLSDYLGTRLGEGGQYQIVPREQIRQRLIAQKLSSHKACFDQSCQIEIGRELAAQYTVSAGIGRVGSQCIITAAIYDLKKAATFKTASAKASCLQDALVEAVDQVASRLRGQPEAVGLPPRQLKSKTVWVAGVLSVLPGGGMFYVGKWGYGLMYAALIVGGVGASFQDKNQDLRVGLWIIAGAAMAGSAVHAMFAADDYREERPDLAPGRDPHPALIVPLVIGSF